MKTYRNHRAEPYFTLVKDGIKTIEVRVKKGKYAEICVGNQITVFNEDETDNFSVVVKGVRFYNSFRELLKTEEFNQVLPNINSIDEGVQVCRKFYTEEQEKEYGVVAIEVEKY